MNKDKTPEEWKGILAILSVLPNLCPANEVPFGVLSGVESNNDSVPVCLTAANILANRDQLLIITGKIGSWDDETMLAAMRWGHPDVCSVATPMIAMKFIKWSTEDLLDLIESHHSQDEPKCQLAAIALTTRENGVEMLRAKLGLAE